MYQSNIFVIQWQFLVLPNRPFKRLLVLLHDMEGHLTAITTSRKYQYHSTPHHTHTHTHAARTHTHTQSKSLGHCIHSHMYLCTAQVIGVTTGKSSWGRTSNLQVAVPCFTGEGVATQSHIRKLLPVHNSLVKTCLLTNLVSQIALPQCKFLGNVH